MPSIPGVVKLLVLHSDATELFFFFPSECCQLFIGFRLAGFSF